MSHDQRLINAIQKKIDDIASGKYGNRKISINVTKGTISIRSTDPDIIGFYVQSYKGWQYINFYFPEEISDDLMIHYIEMLEDSFDARRWLPTKKHNIYDIDIVTYR